MNAYVSFYTACGLAVLGFVSLLLWGCPHYAVYTNEMNGKAELARAESNRRITVLEAGAKQDAAKALAQADIERARGQAEANKIIANGLGGPEGYLRFLWIEAMNHSQGKEVIYIPTEAGLPILEAGRLKK